MEPAEAASDYEGGSALAAVIKRHPLIAFFVLAFALTWAPTPLGVFMAAGPLVAALVITAVVDGRRGLRELGSRMLRWRVGWQWYAAALLVPLGLVFATGGLNVAFGAPGSVIRDLSISEAVLLFAIRLVAPVLSPIGEEPGWRGFALPRLLDGGSPLGATAILAPIVALWHVPLIFIESEDLPPIFLLTTVAVTFFYTWLFVHTDGSVFITIVAHAAEGLIPREFLGSDGWTGSDETQWASLYTAGWCAVAIVLLAFDWQFWRRRTPSDSRAVRSQPVAGSSSASDGGRSAGSGGELDRSADG
jgi:uncharacterized protein